MKEMKVKECVVVFHPERVYLPESYIFQYYKVNFTMQRKKTRSFFSKVYGQPMKQLWPDTPCSYT